MKLEPICFFIDHLGYSEIARKISDDETADKFFKRMKENADLFRSTNSEQQKINYKNMEATGGFNLYKYYDIDYTFISDSIFIVFNPKNIDKIPESLRLTHSANAILVAALRIIEYTTACINDGFFIRGGASNKFARANIDKLVGEGAIDAHELESKHAVYPRIIFSPDFKKNLQLVKKINFLQNAMYGGAKIIDEDEDGFLYINFYNYLIALGSRKSQTIDSAESKGLRVAIINKIIFLQYLDIEEKELYKQLLSIRKNLKAHRENCLKLCKKYSWIVSKRNLAVGGDIVFSKYAIKNEFQSILLEAQHAETSTTTS